MRRITAFSALSIALVVHGNRLAAQPVPPPSPAPIVRARDAAAQVRAVAEQWLARAGAPGVTLAVIDAEGRLTKVAAGFSRLTTRTAMGPDDRMFSGSIGKTYFAAVILQLVGEGTLSLDEKIESRVGGEPWFAGLPNARELTLRSLLNHTSGIAEHVQSPEFVAALKAEPMKRWDFGQMLRTYACGRPALFEPGAGWSYADTNYIVAGLVVEKATGRAVYDLVHERLLVPLKLSDTLPAQGPEIPGLVTGYDPNHLFVEVDEFAVDGRCALNPQFEWCGGGFVSSSPDLARWGRALWGGDVLSPAMKTEMEKGVAESRTGPNDAYGLGVIIWQSPLGRALGHTGMFPGYVSQVFHFREINVTVAMQVNTLDFAKLKGLRQAMVEGARAVHAGQGE